MAYIPFWAYPPEIKCPNCKFKGLAKKHYPGSTCLMLVLLVIFFPAGIIYAWWATTSADWVCPDCGFKNVVIKKVKEQPKKT